MRRGSVGVVVVDLDPTVGREQRGYAPRSSSVILRSAATNDSRCFVSSRSRRHQERSTRSVPGQGGLTRESYALVDQLRAIHKRRIRQVYGRIRESELASIDRGLYLFLGLESPESRITY